MLLFKIMDVKYLLYIMCGLMVGCGSSGWEEIEQNEFLYDCIQAGEDEKNCNCILKCLEKNHNSYKEIMSEILLMGASEKTEQCTVSCVDHGLQLLDSLQK